MALPSLALFFWASEPTIETEPTIQKMEREREQQQEYVGKLRTELKELDIDMCTISDEQLRTWAVRALSPLDVDTNEESTELLLFRLALPSGISR